MELFIDGYVSGHDRATGEPIEEIPVNVFGDGYCAEADTVDDIMSFLTETFGEAAPSERDIQRDNAASISLDDTHVRCMKLSQDTRDKFPDNSDVFGRFWIFIPALSGTERVELNNEKN